MFSYDTGQPVPVAQPCQMLPAHLLEIAGHITPEIPHDIVVVKLSHRKHLQIAQIAQDEEGRTLIGLCNWEKPMTYEDYENLLLYAKTACCSTRR